MYLVDVKTKSGLINTIRCDIDGLQKINPERITNIYLMQPIDPIMLVHTQKIRTTIYEFLKGKQAIEMDVIDHVASSLNINKTDVADVIRQMRDEKAIHLKATTGQISIP